MIKGDIYCRKMKYIFITILLFWGRPITFGQTIIMPDTLMKQKGVKTKTQYECDDKGEKCKVLYKSFFDNNGRLIKYIEFSAETPYEIAYYSYNKFNKADTVYRQFSGEKKYTSQVFHFDKLGNLIEYLDCFEQSGCEPKEKYEYNSSGKIKKKVEMKNGVEENVYKYTYDQLGNNTEIISKNKNSSFIDRELQFFDNNRRKIKSINYSNNEKLDSTEYSYDTKGNLIYLNWMGGLNTKSIYKYDSESNEIDYKSIALGNKEHRIMTYNNKLVQTRIHYEENQVKYFFKFTYEFY